VFGLVWEIAGRSSDSLLLPSASETAASLARLVTTPDLWRAFWLSNQALLLGFPASLAAGVAAGLALARWPTVDRWADVYLDLLLVVPKSALMPLVIMVLGLGLLPRAIVVFTFAFPIIVVTVRSGVKEVDQRLVAMARAFCAKEPQTWRLVLLPGALPAVMTAFRLGLSRAVAGMISVELLLVAVGIGQLVLVFRADFDAPSLYAVIVVVLLEAILLIQVAEHLERRFGAWAGTRTLTGADA
jgi:ABC-type nitrate/sulfonate/bicarbonate transport system permease component